MVDHPFTDKHVSFRLSLSFPTHLLALITQEILRNRERAYSFCEKFPKINRQTLVMASFWEKVHHYRRFSANFSEKLFLRTPLGICFCTLHKDHVIQVI